MGELYRARDSRPNRQVAVKVLPESVAAIETRSRASSVRRRPSRRSRIRISSRRNPP